MRVAVLGAGLQGACVALELALQGVQVDLYDRNDQPLTQASLQNEAKIHLGFFYSNDPTLQTARLVAEGALSFAPLLRRWLGDEIDKVSVSPPYYYAVSKDSLVSVDAVEQHLEATSRIIRELAPAGVDYFGVDPREAPGLVTNREEFFDPESVAAAFRTPEVAISAAELADIVRAGVADQPRIRCVMNATVLGVTRDEACPEVSFESGGETYRESYDHVVNALWDGRLAIDATAGITPDRPWLFRTKYDVHVPSVPVHAKVPAVSIVLGAFGDLVRYANGEMYLSWYPAGLKAITSSIKPPDAPPILAGMEAQTIRRETFEALIRVVPALADLALYCLCEASEVKGGVIFAWGQTDISDPTSDLHTRFDVGPKSYGRYHSIDTGKLTTAPLFAKTMADKILGPP